MNTDNYFVRRKPANAFLATLVDYYFYIDIAVSELRFIQEAVIPYPRLNFLYFFNHPFLVTNHTLGEAVTLNMAISRITTDQITIQPQTDWVKVIGAHIYPHCLAYFTKQPIHSLPWLVNTIDLFGKIATDFQQRIEKCSDAEQLFNEVEKVFLDNILVKDLSLITNAIQLIEKNAGDMQLRELSQRLSVSERTLRTHFHDHVGCSPKEFIRLVKLKQIVFQLKHSENSLTSIAYDNNYFDQAHFVHEVKKLTGSAPNKLKKEIPNFRFLQF